MTTLGIILYAIVGTFVGVMCILPTAMAFGDSPKWANWKGIVLFYLSMFVAFFLWPIAVLFILATWIKVDFIDKED